MSAKYTLIARELEQQLSRSGGKKLPTEAELCRRFGCSRQTVRSALAVLEKNGLIIRRQGSGSYPAGSQASGSRQIAVILADREEYLSPALLRDIRKAAEDEGCTVTCLQTGGSRRQERAHLAALLMEKPAGIILEPIADVQGSFHEDLLHALLAAGVNMVCINGQYAQIPLCVRGDDAAGTEALIAWLVSRGHREIGCILRADDSRGIRRYRAAIKAAPELGARISDESVLWYTALEHRRMLEGDERLLRRFLAEYRKTCSAVICFNDELAFRMVRAARAESRPLTVTGFDSSYLTLSSQVPITSVGISGPLGAAAVRLLLHGPADRFGPCVELPCSLSVRDPR